MSGQTSNYKIITVISAMKVSWTVLGDLPVREARKGSLRKGIFDTG